MNWNWFPTSLFEFYSSGQLKHNWIVFFGPIFLGPILIFGAISLGPTFYQFSKKNIEQYVQN